MKRNANETKIEIAYFLPTGRGMAYGPMKRKVIAESKVEAFIDTVLDKGGEIYGTRDAE